MSFRALSKVSSSVTSVFPTSIVPIVYAQLPGRGERCNIAKNAEIIDKSIETANGIND